MRHPIACVLIGCLFFFVRDFDGLGSNDSAHSGGSTAKL